LRGLQPVGDAGAGGGWLVSIVLIALVTLAGAMLSAHGNDADISILYLIPVIYAGTRHGLGTGLGTGLIAAAAYDFVFVPPYYSFAIADPSHAVSMVILIGTALVCSQLSGQVRRQAHLAQANADHNGALAGFARMLMAINRREDLWPLLAREIARLLQVRTIVLTPDPKEDPGRRLAVRAAVPPRDALDLIDGVAARWAFDTGRPTGPGSDSMAVSEWVFQPVCGGNLVHAVLGVARDDAHVPLAADQWPLFISLLDQAGLALARIAAEEDVLALGKVQERDRLRAALLSSIGHDLRTPLTTVLGMLRAIRPADTAQRHQIDTARGEAERLDRFVANLLDMVRIETGGLERALEPVDLNEAVTAALDDLRRVLGTQRVQVDVARDLPLVMADPVLLHHCLINLIDNAAKYGCDGAITVRARAAGEGLALSVIDEGPGIRPGEEQRVFGMFTRLEGSDRRGGTGLGLAIVKGFAQAMGMEAAAANRGEQAGAVFTLLIPPENLRAVEGTA
jgi:two-component system, OmpR family, sensor histidine kinase KdpD